MNRKLKQEKELREAINTLKDKELVEKIVSDLENGADMDILELVLEHSKAEEAGADIKLMVELVKKLLALPDDKISAFIENENEYDQLSIATSMVKLMTSNVADKVFIGQMKDIQTFYLKAEKLDKKMALFNAIKKINTCPEVDRPQAIQDFLQLLNDQVYSLENPPEIWATSGDSTPESDAFIRNIISEAVKDITKNRRIIRAILTNLGGKAAKTGKDSDKIFLKQLSKSYFDAFKNQSDEFITNLLTEDFDYALTKVGQKEIWFQWSIDSPRNIGTAEGDEFWFKWSDASGKFLLYGIEPLLFPAAWRSPTSWVSVASWIEKAPMTFVEKILAKADKHLFLKLLDEIAKLNDTLTAATRVAYVACKRFPGDSDFEKHLAEKLKYPEFAQLLATFNKSTSKQLLTATESIDPALKPWRTITGILPSDEAGELFKYALKNATDSALTNLSSVPVEIDTPLIVREKWIEFFLSQETGVIEKYLAGQIKVFAINSVMPKPYSTLTNAFITAKTEFPDLADQIDYALKQWGSLDGLNAVSVLYRLAHKGLTDLEKHYAREYFKRVTQTSEAWQKVSVVFEPLWSSVEVLFEGHNLPVIPALACTRGEEQRDGKCQPCGKDALPLSPGICECQDGFEKLSNGDCQKPEPKNPEPKNPEIPEPSTCKDKDTNAELIGNECMCKPGFALINRLCTAVRTCPGGNVKLIDNECKCDKGYTMNDGICQASGGLVSWITGNPVQAALGTVTTLGAGVMALRQLRRSQQPLPAVLEIKMEKKPVEKVKSSAWKWWLALVFLLIAIISVVVARYYSRLFN